MKELQTLLQNKETTVQSSRKMSDQNTKKSPGIKVALFNGTGYMGMNIFGCLNRSLSLFYFCFLTNLRKKIFMAYIRLQLNPPPPPPSPPYEPVRRPPSKRTYFMDDPKSFIFCELNLLAFLLLTKAKFSSLLDGSHSWL